MRSGGADDFEAAAGDGEALAVIGEREAFGSCGVNISLALDCPTATVGESENGFQEVLADSNSEPVLCFAFDENEDEKPRLVCINFRNWYLFRMYFSSSLSRSESIKSVGGGISFGLKMAFELRFPVTRIA